MLYKHYPFTNNCISNYDAVSPDDVTGDSVASIDAVPSGTHVAIMFSGAEVSRHTGVIVESWDHVQQCGQVRRAWLNEFTDQERAKLSKLHAKARAWVLRSGHPDHIRMSFATFQLMTRAANFFASH